MQTLTFGSTCAAHIQEPDLPAFRDFVPAGKPPHHKGVHWHPELPPIKELCLHLLHVLHLDSSHLFHLQLATLLLHWGPPAHT